MRRTYPPSTWSRPSIGVGIGVLVALVACLNPMPDDFPSERDSVPTGSSGVDENPAAGGGAGTGGYAPGAATGSGGTSADVPEPPSEADDDDAPDAGASTPGDAGTEVGDGGT